MRTPKHASVYLRDNKIYIVPYMATRTGPDVGKLPVVVTENGEWKSVGYAVLAAMYLFERGAPPDWKSYRDPFCRVLGVGEKKVYDGTISCFIEFDEDTIKVFPMENKGKGGFDGISESLVMTHEKTKDPQTIGDLVKQGLAKSR